MYRQRYIVFMVGKWVIDKKSPINQSLICGDSKVTIRNHQNLPHAMQFSHQYHQQSSFLHCSDLLGFFLTLVKADWLVVVTFQGGPPRRGLSVLILIFTILLITSITSLDPNRNI